MPSRQIPLSKGYVAIVDEEDYEALAAHKWSASVVGKRGRVYAVRSVRSIDGEDLRIAMHREIARPAPGFEVDHRDGDTLNNRRSNLRIATRSQNNANARKRLKTSSCFKGVSFHHQTGKWAAQILKRHLGLFSTEEEAALAYDKAARIYGEFRRPNLLERDLQKQILDFLALDGWRCLLPELNFSERKRKAVGEPGMPDLLAIRYLGFEKPRRGRFDAFRMATPETQAKCEVLWLEVKTPEGVLAPHQRAWHKRERERGALTLVAGIDFDPSIEGFARWYAQSGLQRQKMRLGGEKEKAL